MLFELHLIRKDPRYRSGITWGKPRRGHPEATVEAHIEELSDNLTRLREADLVTSCEAEKLEFMILIHDTFKGDSERGVAITHPKSHASLARAFAEEYTDDQDILEMIQYHDEWYAVSHKGMRKGLTETRTKRLQALVDRIQNWDLYIKFIIIDNTTAGKKDTPVRWFLQEIEKLKPGTQKLGEQLLKVLTSETNQV